MKYWLFLLTVLTAGLATPVFADARDEVMGAADRCAVFADPRTWLDCYYGAAQPMRAQLGLVPAPESQTRFVPMAVPGAAPAQRATQTAVNAPNGGSSFFDRVWGGGKPQSSWTGMQSYSFDNRGLFTVHLVDGTTWKQVPSDSNRARLNLPATTYQAIILAGDHGGTNMRIGGGVGLFIVEKEKER